MKTILNQKGINPFDGITLKVNTKKKNSPWNEAFPAAWDAIQKAEKGILGGNSFFEVVSDQSNIMDSGKRSSKAWAHDRHDKQGSIALLLTASICKEAEKAFEGYKLI